MFARPTARLSATLTLAALAGLCHCAVAQAQWQWRDAAGRSVFSDTPPPPTVPAASVIKAPGRFASMLRPVDAAAPAAAASPADMPSAAPVEANAGARAEAKAEARPDATASAEQAFQKRRADALKAEADQAARDKAAQERQARCAGMRNYATALQQNRRIAVSAPDGSPQHLDDDQRQAELQRTNESLAANCA
ncbi:DUF4124 domain-containing protein [Cupriavidus sp. 30B13]|uniref:DUF4124 domain-containing protein n=1 Tax=Cupriavidus sp. 30B13 TaxID=3384241 RepID=UPI003B8F5F00